MKKQYLIRLFLNVVILSCTQTIFGSTSFSGKKSKIQSEQYPFIITKISTTKKTTIVECSFGGEYSVNYFSKKGNYLVQSDAKCEFMISDDRNNSIGEGNGYVIITIPVAGNYRIHVSLDGKKKECHKITVSPIVEKPDNSNLVTDFISVASSDRFKLQLSTREDQVDKLEEVTLGSFPFFSNEKDKTIVDINTIKFSKSLNIISTIHFLTTYTSFSFLKSSSQIGKLEDPFSVVGRVLKQKQG